MIQSLIVNILIFSIYAFQYPTTWTNSLSSRSSNPSSISNVDITSSISSNRPYRPCKLIYRREFSHRYVTLWEYQDKYVPVLLKKCREAFIHVVSFTSSSIFPSSTFLSHLKKYNEVSSSISQNLNKSPRRYKTSQSLTTYETTQKVEDSLEIVDISSQTPSMIAQVNKQALRSYGTSFVREAVKNVGASVVRIDCEREVAPMLSIFNDVYREHPIETIKVSGSGVVASEDGFIITNAHVVQDSKKATITLSNGRTFKVQIVATDELTDLAVLKAELDSQTKLVPAPLGNSDVLLSGDWVIAVGCPVGLDFTVTLGIVSNPKRSSTEVGAPYLRGNYIQTDAALNSGNSGGPLISDSGEVIGINTMVRSNTEAIGFAIPINRVKEIYKVLKLGNKPNHSYFGMEVMSLTPDYAKIHNDDPNAVRLPMETKGALIVRVLPGSPAAIAGLRKFDVIVEIGEKGIVENSNDAEMLLDGCKPGSSVKIRVLRGETKTMHDIFTNPMDLSKIIEEKKRMQQQQPQPHN